MFQTRVNLFESRKRPHSPDSDDECSCKLNCPHHINFVLASESSLPTDEDSEDVYSVQFAETASPKDTSDTTWTSDSKSMDVEEFEVASIHSDEKLLSNCDSSCTDDMLVTTAAAATVLATAKFPLKAEESLWADSSSDVESLGADSSDVESRSDSSDSEVPRADYWECVRCKCKCTPLFRFCLKCFQLRKGYLAERPKRVHPRMRKRQSTGATAVSLTVAAATKPETASVAEDTGLELMASPEPMCSTPQLPSAEPLSSAPQLPSAQPLPSTPQLPSGEPMSSTPQLPSFPSESSLYSPSENTLSLVKTDSGISLTGEGSSQSQPSGSEEAKGEMLVADKGDRSSESSELCHMCVERRRTGGFVHKKTVHVMCCYECALRVWNTTKVCPMCNRRPQNVARVIYS